MLAMTQQQSHSEHPLLPAKEPQVREELDDVTDEVIAPYAKAKNLPYLRACVDESLRRRELA
ncbi:hypothetical protein N7460_000343 [Penicillium canescens]|uniref:Uncharacterized protein n=1 Tax=Penicillium canescens TaxID=5083 RepID=A0AAD6NE34_PENCN|nr:hypothetical protein N7444_011508 [Penicillium canescens]KAJ6057069.1 hypothetical protein N7460_000343 [Penicillium canescens]